MEVSPLGHLSQFVISRCANTLIPSSLITVCHVRLKQYAKVWRSLTSRSLQTCIVRSYGTVKKSNLFACTTANGRRAFKTPPGRKWRQNLDGTAPEILSVPAIRPRNECSRVTETLTLGGKKRVACNVRQTIGESNVNQFLFKHTPGETTSPEGSFFTLVAAFENIFCQFRRRNHNAPYALSRNAV